MSLHRQSFIIKREIAKVLIRKMGTKAYIYMGKALQTYIEFLIFSTRLYKFII